MLRDWLWLLLVIRIVFVKISCGHIFNDNLVYALSPAGTRGNISHNQVYLLLIKNQNRFMKCFGWIWELATETHHDAKWLNDSCLRTTSSVRTFVASTLNVACTRILYMGIANVIQSEKGVSQLFSSVKHHDMSEHSSHKHFVDNKNHENNNRSKRSQKERENYIAKK